MSRSFGKAGPIKRVIYTVSDDHTSAREDAKRLLLCALKIPLDGRREVHPTMTSRELDISRPEDPPAKAREPAESEADQYVNESMYRIVQELAERPIRTGWQAVFDSRTRAMVILNLSVIRSS
jgi:hypothetical protein